MDKAKHKVKRRERRHIGIRKRVEGTSAKPRLCVYRSLNHIYAQIIDDLAGKTICSASSTQKDLSLKGKSGNSSAAAAVGESLAKKAVKAGVKEVAFDRAGFKFHGRVKALADAARKQGLKF